MSCVNCEEVYIGQTGRALKTRIREHERDVLVEDNNSLLSKRCLRAEHAFGFDGVHVIDGGQGFPDRLFLASWRSVCGRGSIGGRSQFPGVCAALV
ncbi:hypothetical protein, partial [Salmonella sp. s55004]|uniref:hypothetical protein n=1 Tax=Salmonella sp. s55004 TaxID=3159675 RepID=UPI003980461C